MHQNASCSPKPYRVLVETWCVLIRVQGIAVLIIELDSQVAFWCSSRSFGVLWVNAYLLGLL